MTAPFQWSNYIPERMKKGKAYTPGEQRNTSDWIKLNTNEFPFDPSPNVAAAITQACDKLRFYPEPTGKALRETIASQNDVDPDQIILFNGCDDALNCCIRGLLEPGERAAYLNPSYSLYTTLLGNHGIEGLPIEYGENFGLPVEAMAAAEAKVFLLTSPNAPSGVAFDASAFRSLIRKKEAVFVMDETYGDFAEWSAIPMMNEFPNLIVVKSFSKTFGLAGLRLGFGIFPRDAIETFHKIRDVYNVDRLSQAGGMAALMDLEYYEEKHQVIRKVRNRMKQFLETQLDWRVFPSSTNFLFVFPRNAEGVESKETAQDLVSFLVENRILVRYFSNHPLIESGVRISIGTPEQMDEVQNQIKRWATTA